MKSRLLIEDFMPLATISAASAREKKAGRAYHPSMLHWWWARRPLAAARAAVLATLVPASAFPTERVKIEDMFARLTAWRGDEIGMSASALAEARGLIEAAWPGQPPRVIDSFVGGGAIPLEALRLGAQAAGVEVNPVAHLVATATLVWPQRYGATLADDVERWATWVRERTWSDVRDLYPVLPGKAHSQLGIGGESPGGDAPVAYLWSRTVTCPNQAVGRHVIPLTRSGYAVRKAGKRIVIKAVPHSDKTRCRFELIPGGQVDAREGRSSASACPICSAAISPSYLAHQGASGGIGHQLMAVVERGAGGKHYSAIADEEDAVPDAMELEERIAALREEGLEPPAVDVEPMGNAGLASGKTFLYGIKTFEDVFTRRQLLTLLTLCKYVRLARQEMEAAGLAPERADIVAAYIAIVVNRVVDRSSSLCRWNLSGEKAESPFVKDRLAMVWDYVEVNPFAGISGDFTRATRAVCEVIRHCASLPTEAIIERASATSLPFEDASFDAAITDPPYYDNLSYANSSDYYYVWLKLGIGHLFPEHFVGLKAPKKREIVAAAYRHGGDKTAAAREYEELMTEAFLELRRVLKEGAPLVVVYAHQTTEGWTTMIESLRQSGFMVVEAWPIDTELSGRRGGQENASLASSIFLVARRRESNDVGEWSELRQGLRDIVVERVASLAAMGIGGPDLVIAVIAAALRPYMVYAAVQKPNGEVLRPDEYLREVEREVADAILERILNTDRAALGQVDQETQFYVIGRFEFGGALAPWDEVNTLARGTGVELRELTNGEGSLLAFGTKRNLVKLRDYRERGAAIDIGRSTIDHLHRVLWLADNEPRNIKDYLAVAQPDPERLRLVAHALSRPGLDSTGVRDGEADACERLLGVWKRLIEDNLFTAGGS